MVDLEVHQLELRYAALRVVSRGRRALLVASLSEHGQRSPILVVVEGDRYVLIDGYARVGALTQLGCDLVHAVVLDVSEAEALVLAHRLETGRRRSAIEEGWLIAELIERHGLDQIEVAGRLQRSRSWVSRRLALVRTLPASVQDAVRAGTVPPQGAMKYLVPLSRANKAQCECLVSHLTEPTSVRALERLYRAWRAGDDVVRARIVERPALFLKVTEPPPPPPADDPATPLLNDLEGIAGMCRRARRRVREGVIDVLDATRRARVGRALREARLTFDAVHELLEAPCSIEIPAPPS